LQAMKQASNDEDYLTLRARRKPSLDANGDGEPRVGDNAETRAQLKSWLVTARLMFPKKFEVQYEAYHFEKEEGRADEAAKHFRQLYLDFGKQSENTAKLWAEIDAIVDLLSTPGREEAFLCRLFENLPGDAQRELLLAAAFHSKDPIERTKKMLLAMRKYPDLIAKHGGLDCLSFVTSKCKKNLRQQPHVNDLLRLLITEVAPLLIPVSSLHVEQPALHDLMVLTFEYIFAILTNSKQGNEPVPWSDMLKSFVEIGKRMGWTITENLTHLESEDPLAVYQKIVSYYQNKSSKDRLQEEVQGQVFYVCTLLFLKSLSTYLWHAQGLDGVAGSTLVEAFITHEANNEMEPQLKRRRTTDDERRVPEVTHGDEGEPSRLVHAFLYAVRYYDLLASDQPLISRLQSQVRPPESLILPFYIDMALYQGHFKEALQTARHLPTPTSPGAQCRYHLKVASLYHAAGDHHSMTDQALQALSVLAACKPEDPVKGVAASDEMVANSRTPNISRQAKQLTLPTSKLRHAHFLEFNRQSIIAYCTRLMIYGLKEKVMQPIAKNDLALGHIIVLLQHCFPEENDLFYLLMHRIRMSENFSYPIFMSHIIHIEFLEEFSHLMADSTTNVTLDIAPTFTGAPASSTTPGSTSRRMGTRGVNRGEKNEIKTAIKKQVMRCYENLDEILLDFVAKNKDSLFQCML
jgi:integrator complex subunit 10